MFLCYTIIVIKGLQKIKKEVHKNDGKEIKSNALRTGTR